MERQFSYPRRSAGRAERRAATANPQKSADAIVVGTLKLVGLGEGQNLTKRATTLDYPMKEEKQKTMESCPQNDSAEREGYEGAVKGDLFLTFGLNVFPLRRKFCSKIWNISFRA